MTELGIVVGGVLIGLLLAQIWLVWGFVRALSSPAIPIPNDEQCPKAAIILCLRGSDPFLSRCLEAVLDQDYPQYEVRVVIDNTEDPTRKLVESIVARRDSKNVRLEFLHEPGKSCSLKCSSVVQAVRGLDDSFEFIAQLDADTIPHRSWLRELAGGLADPHVGAATGNRWYMPARRNWGSIIRYLWNAAAVVQMYWYRIAWGGTLAVKTRVIREAGLLEHWSRALCEDTMLYSKLRRHGYQVKFIPSLMMVNRESCDVESFRRWVTRQLLTARLYHPGWPAVVGHAVLTTIAPVAALVLIAWSVATDWTPGSWFCLGSLLVYQLALTPIIGWMEAQVRQQLIARRDEVDQASLAQWLKMFFAVPATQVVYAQAMLGALTLRQIEWRGVEYRIRGSWDIQMDGYRPYVQTAESDSLESL